MLTSARIGEDLETEEGVRWITAWKVPQIQQWAADGNLQVARLEQQDLAEIRHPRIRENVGLPAAIPYGPKSGNVSEKRCSAPRRNRGKKIRAATPRSAGRARPKRDRCGGRPGAGPLPNGEALQLNIEEDRFDLEAQTVGY